MKRTISGFGVTFLLAASGCKSTMPMSVECAFGPGVKYDAKDASFDWSPAAAESLKRMDDENPHLHALIFETVEKELAAKNYWRRTYGNPDFHVAYALSRRDTADPWTMEPLTEGTIRLDLTDPETGNLMYRGTATIKVDRTADPDERKATIKEAVHRMLEKFPTAKSSKSAK